MLTLIFCHIVCATQDISLIIIIIIINSHSCIYAFMCLLSFLHKSNSALNEENKEISKTTFPSSRNSQSWEGEHINEMQHSMILTDTQSGKYFCASAELTVSVWLT